MCAVTFLLADKDLVKIPNKEPKNYWMWFFSLFILCVYFVLPKICVFVLVATAGINNVSKILSLYSFTLMFINSSLNPFVYCWKMRHIRNAIRATKRNLRRRACNSRSGNLYFVAFSWEREGVPTQERVDRC